MTNTNIVLELSTFNLAQFLTILLKWNIRLIRCRKKCHIINLEKLYWFRKKKSWDWQINQVILPVGYAVLLLYIIIYYYKYHTTNLTSFFMLLLWELFQNVGQRRYTTYLNFAAQCMAAFWRGHLCLTGIRQYGYLIVVTYFITYLFI